MNEQPAILSEKRGHLAVIRLNRPHALNAMTFRMLADFNQAVASAAADNRIFGIAITGNGRGFCAGLDAADISAAAATADRRLEDRGIDPAMPAQFAQLLKIGKPVIAAVNGPAAGIGLVLALMCDLRFVADNAFFITSFSHCGLIAEHGASWLLPSLVGRSRALDLLWSSRKVPADEAYRIGLADRVTTPDDLLDTAQAYVDDLAANASPRSIAIMKDMVYRHSDLPLREALVDADRLATESLNHPDCREGVRALVEKRAPRFAPWGD